MSHKELLVFLHIFKTGGTSLYNMMSKIYGQQYVLANPSHIKSRVKHNTIALAGHIPLSDNHLDILYSLDRNLRFITLLRDPVERVISDYHWIRNYDFEYQIDRNATLIELLERGFGRGINVMTTYLSGSRDRNAPDLDLAKYRLEHVIEVFGFIEHYDLFLDQLQERFGWPHLSLGHAKNNPKRPPSELPETIEAVKHYNQYDIELYDFAQRLYASTRRPLR